MSDTRTAGTWTARLRADWIATGLPACFGRPSAGTLAILGCLALAFTAVIAGLWGIRFTTFDDATTFGDWRAPLPLAQAQGRFYLVYFLALLYFVNGLWQTIAYDIVHCGSLVGAAAMVGLVLARYVSPQFALINAFIYIASYVVIWEHTLAAGVPLCHHLAVITTCATLLALHAYRRTGSTGWLVATGGLFLWSLVGAEYQVVIVTGLTLICLYAGFPEAPGQAPAPDISSRERRRAAIVFASLAVAYVMVMLGWRWIYGNPYSGTQIATESFDARAFLGVLMRWTTSTHVFDYWHSRYVFSAVFSDQLQPHRLGLRLQDILAAFDGAALLRTAAVAVGLMILFRMPRDPALDRGRRIWIPVVALVVMLVPSAMIAITSKYQEWYRLRVVAYTYTSLSAYGFTILLTWGFFTLRDGWLYPWWRRWVEFALAAILVAAAVTSGVMNSRVTTAMKDATARWYGVDLLMTSPLRREVEGRPLIAPRLADFYWSVPGPVKYWQPFFKFVYGADVDVRLRIAPNANLHSPSHYFDFFRLPGNSQYAAVLSRVELRNGKLWSREFHVIAAGPLNASFYAIGPDGGLHRTWLPSRKHVRHGRLHIYTVQTPEVESPLARIDDQNFWTPPKVVE